MNKLPDEVASENFLNESGLLIKVGETFSIDILLSFEFITFSCVEGPKVSLYCYRSCFFSEKFLAFDVHLEFRLYFQGCSVVSLPVFFALIRFEVVDFFDSGEESLLLSRQFH